MSMPGKAVPVYVLGIDIGSINFAWCIGVITKNLDPQSTPSPLLRLSVEELGDEMFRQESETNLTVIQRILEFINEKTNNKRPLIVKCEAQVPQCPFNYAVAHALLGLFYSKKIAGEDVSFEMFASRSKFKRHCADTRAALPDYKTLSNTTLSSKRKQCKANAIGLYHKIIESKFDWLDVKENVLSIFTLVEKEKRKMDDITDAFLEVFSEAEIQKSKMEAETRAKKRRKIKV